MTGSLYYSTQTPLVILSVAKDQLPVLDSPYCGTIVSLASSIHNVEDSYLPT